MKAALVRKTQPVGAEGFVIVVVLWMLASLAALASIYALYTVNTTTELDIYRQRVRADALIRSGLELAYYELSAAQEGRLQGSFGFSLRKTPVSVSYRTESARIDLNVSPKELIAGLFKALGARDAAAEDFADRIIAWRSKETNASLTALRNAGIQNARLGPLPHVGELAALGIPEIWVRRASPFVTVYSGRPGINLSTAAPEVIAALPNMNPAKVDKFLAQRSTGRNDPKQLAAAFGLDEKYIDAAGSDVVRVHVSTRLSGGETYGANIVIVPIEGGPSPYAVLTWDDDVEAAERNRV